MPGAGEHELIRWLEAQAPAERVGRGHQGEIHLYEKDGRRLVIKTACGRGVPRWLRAHMLRREFAAYQRLQGFAGSPRCHGLLEGKYLVLDYVPGDSIRHASITNPARFFDQLFALTRELHARGVAHADLKRMDNLLVVDGSRPYIIDFGVAILRKEGFAPVNHFLFRLACRFDLNAWIKHKYRKRMSEISDPDRAHYRRTLIETVFRETKRAYTTIKRRLTRQR